jgi:hypothetical protein
VGVAFWLPAVANHALVRTTAAVSGWAEQSRQAIRGLISGSEDLKKAPPFQFRRAGHPNFRIISVPRATRHDNKIISPGVRLNIEELGKIIEVLQPKPKPLPISESPLFKGLMKETECGGATQNVSRSTLEIV